MIAAAALLLAALSASPALAQRVFVAAQGSDANPCTFALPCRTFQHAHDTVAAGGEIDVLDPAGYGPFTITKAISVQGHGFAGISVPSGNGILVSASATDIVSLNGLLIDGSGVGINGINLSTGKALVVENCVVRRMSNSGLVFVSSTAGVQTLSVSDSYFTDNANFGIVIQTGNTGPVTAAIRRTALYGNGVAGLEVDGEFGTGPLNVAATDTVAGANGIGYVVSSAAAKSVTSLVLTRASAVGNFIGIDSPATNATLRLSESTVTGNSFGYDASGGGVILSYGDNDMAGNGSDVGVLGSASKQ
jgi:hypothetical protein